jgi:hypothetical protein
MIPYEFDEVLREERVNSLIDQIPDDKPKMRVINQGFFITKNDTGYAFERMKEKSVPKSAEKEKPIIEQIIDNVYASLLKLNPLILYDNVKEQVINYLNKNNLLKELTL